MGVEINNNHMNSQQIADRQMVIAGEMCDTEYI